MANENSALFALAEIHELETRRIEHERARRQAEIDAQRVAEQQAAAQAEAHARFIVEQQAQHAAHAAAIQAERERDERFRVAQAEAIARAEHEMRVRQEELRLQAQLKLAERRARPRWPLFAAPLLMLAVVGAGVLAWRGSAEADARADELAAQRDAHEERIAAIADRVAALQTEQHRLEADRAALEQRLAEAATADEKAQLTKELDELRARLAASEGKDSQTTPKTTGKTTGKTTRTHTTTRTTGEATSGEEQHGRPPRERIEVGEGGDPLTGIERH